MANTSKHLTATFTDNFTALMPAGMVKTQAAQTLYAGAGITIDSNGYGGTWTAAERLIGLASADTPHVDRTAATAAQAGKDIPVTVGGYIAVTISGASLDDLEKTVFQSDDQTYTFTMTAGKQVGKVVWYDTYTSKLIVDTTGHWGSNEFSTWCTLTKKVGSVTTAVAFPSATAAIIQLVAGAYAGVLAISAAGAVTVLATTATGSVDDISSSGGKITVADAGTYGTIANETASDLVCVIKYLGTPI